MSDTSSFVKIGDLSRRDVLRQIALALTAAGAMSPAAAQEVHRHTQEERKQTGKYTPKFFKPQEYQTISWLAELIVPADGQSGSAVDAGAPEFIDLLCSQNEKLGHIYSGGLLWLDARMRQQHSVWFLEASQEQQVALLNELVEAERALAAKDTSFDPNFVYRQFRDYGVDTRTDLTPGVVFFDWIRKMTVDAYYTSPIGIKDLGYVGNTAVSKYEVPQDILNDAMRRSPFGPA